MTQEYKLIEAQEFETVDGQVVQAIATIQLRNRDIYIHLTLENEMYRVYCEAEGNQKKYVPQTYFLPIFGFIIADLERDRWEDEDGIAFLKETL